MRVKSDLWGVAIEDFFYGRSQGKMLTETTISEKDEFHIGYLFRSYDQMPEIEQKALDMSFGEVLEVGCGAGSHGLYLQNEKQLSVTALDWSPKAVEVCRKRGVRNVVCSDVMQMQGTFDTILLLMNGAGLCGRIKKMKSFLQQLKKLLRPQGQILMDSSDIIYMFDRNPDGSYEVPLYFDYYGELDFTIHYNRQSQTFNWLYVDFETLKNIVESVGFSCRLIKEGPHYDYLAQLTLKS